MPLRVTSNAEMKEFQVRVEFCFVLLLICTERLVLLV